MYCGPLFKVIWGSHVHNHVKRYPTILSGWLKCFAIVQIDYNWRGLSIIYSLYPM